MSSTTDMVKQELGKIRQFMLCWNEDTESAINLSQRVVWNKGIAGTKNWPFEKINKTDIT